MGNGPVNNYSHTTYIIVAGRVIPLHWFHTYNDSAMQGLRT